MADSTPLLSIDAIDVHYGAVQALYGVSLAVHAGEVVSVLGGNASGKSTTLKSVLGLVSPTRGRIRLDGREIHGRRPADVIDLGLASVPEGRRVFPAMSVEENLLLGAYPRRKEKAAIAQDLAEVFEVFPRLAERRAQAAGTLSGGEQQMLALGRALISKPALLLADEISLGLAPLIVESLFEVLVRLNREGMAILLAEQNAREAFGHAHTAYVMETGRITMSGPAAEMATDPRIVDAYLRMS